MNKIRRKALAELIEQIESIKAELEELKEEEEEYRDNIPENLQGSARYFATDEACDWLDSAIEGLEGAMDCIEQATTV